MPSNDNRKYAQVVDYIQNQIGADVSRDLVEVAVVSQDIAQSATDIDQIGGTDQSGVDVADKIDQLEDALEDVGTDEFRSRIHDSNGSQIDPATVALEEALKSNDTDEFVSRLAGADGLEVQEEALDTGVNATDVALLTYLARALNTVDQDELISRLTDSSGSQIDPATNTDQPNWFDDDIIGHDLIGTGDYTIPETNVRGTGDLSVKIASSDGNIFSVTVEWTDGSGNVLYSQEPPEANEVTDTNLKFNVSSDYFQLTVTDDSGGTANNIDGTVNAH